MNHRRGLDRHQTLLLPARLEDYIAAENPIRFLDAFVASLDLRALGFAHAVVQNTGSPPYDPADLLRLYLYGYLHRVRSSRMLEAEYHRNVPQRRTHLGTQRPDPATGFQSLLGQTLRHRRHYLVGVLFSPLSRQYQRSTGHGVSKPPPPPDFRQAAGDLGWSGRASQ